MTNVIHSELTGLDLHPAKFTIFAGVPATTPAYIGQTQFDSSTYAIYTAIGTASPSDWVTQSIPAPITTGPGSPNTVTLLLSMSNVLSAVVNVSVLNPLLSISYTQIPDFTTGVQATTIFTSQLSGVVSVPNGGTGLSAAPAVGQLLIGNGTSYTLNPLVGTANQIIVTNGTGTITLSTPQNIATTSSPTFATMTLTGSLEGSTTLDLGTASSTVVNVATGSSIAALNMGISTGTTSISGSYIDLETSLLQTEALTLILNQTGASSSGANAGIQVKENGTVDAYVVTSSDRLSWVMKAPASSGTVTFTPSSLSIVINQDVSTSATPMFASYPRVVVSSILTGTTTLAVGVGTYPVNTSGGSFTVTLPTSSSAGIGHQVVLVDVGGVADANNLTIATAGGDTINGLSTCLLDSEYESLTLQVTASGVWSVI